jgi:uncharacterized protein
MRELATDSDGLEILHLGDCYGLLAAAPVGRIGFTAGGEAAILPVTFLLDGQDVVFSTAAGTTLSSAEVGQYVVFEADHYDPATRSGWSVTVNGLAELVDSGDETARLDGLGLQPWGTAADRVWVRVRPVSVSGRRIPAPAASTAVTGRTDPRDVS